MFLSSTKSAQVSQEAPRQAELIMHCRNEMQHLQGEAVLLSGSSLGAGLSPP